MKRLVIAAAVLAVAFNTAHALTEQEIQASINAATQAGGGDVVIPPGTHLTTKGLMVKDARKLRITGSDSGRSILKLPPLAFAEVAQAAEPGEARLSTKGMQGLVAGMQIQIEADGAIDVFTKKPKPYHLAVVESIEGPTLVLKEPLKFAVPAGTLIRDPRAPNLIEFRECRIGINLWRWCKQPGLNEGNQITGNIFERTGGNGMQIGRGTANNVITENEIKDSGSNGISVSGSRQVVKANRITGSKGKDIAVGEPGAVVE